MAHRVIQIHWLPRSPEDWTAFTDSRREAARLWNRMARIHRFCRKRRWPWPTEKQYDLWMRNKFPHLPGMSKQALVRLFLKSIKGTSAKRKLGTPSELARYPKTYRLGREGYRDVTWENNQVRARDGWLILPNKSLGALRIPLPDDILIERAGAPNEWQVCMGDRIEGRLMQVQIAYGVVRIIVEISDEARQDGSVIGVDLGVNTLIAATDGERAVLISGRQAKSIQRLRAKELGKFSRTQSRKQRGSRRWKRLQRAKRVMLNKCRNRIQDLLHKATRQIADAFPDAHAFVGKPFNDASRRIGRRQAQNVSQACNRRIIDLLGYKLAQVTVIDEHYTSQTCPNCGERSKHRRVYVCSHCSFIAPRDVVGSMNILDRGVRGDLTPGRTVPREITYLQPVVRGCSRAEVSRLPVVTPGEVRAVCCLASNGGGSQLSPVTPCVHVEENPQTVV